MATHTRILPAMDRKMTSDRKMPAVGKKSSLQFNKRAKSWRESSSDRISDSEFSFKRVIIIESVSVLMTCT